MSNSEGTAAARPAFADPRYSSWTAASLLEGQQPSWLILVSGVLALAYGPLLWMFFDQQWQKPHYLFFTTENMTAHAAIDSIDMIPLQASSTNSCFVLSHNVLPSIRWSIPNESST